MIWINRYHKIKSFTLKVRMKDLYYCLFKIQINNLIIKSRIWITKTPRYILLKQRGPVSYSRVFRSNFHLLHYLLSMPMYVFGQF